MGGSTGYATTLPGKEKKVATVTELLKSSEMIFSIPGNGLTVSETQKLRESLPEGSTMSVVKNTLMKRAVEGTSYDVATSILKGSNMWFFIEEDIGGTIKAFKTFVKEEEKDESHPVGSGVIDGKVVTSAEVLAIAKLPSKHDLYTMIASRVKAIPTKVARVVKAPGSKVARAIKLATEAEGEDS